MLGKIALDIAREKLADFFSNDRPMGGIDFGNGFPELNNSPKVVSTVRFSKVIEACGKPDIHLLLIDPAKDKTLQAAIKSGRVMTLYQQSGSTDHGIVGFEQGRSRQFLVFPKSLKPFDGQRIVGIKYEFLEDAPVPERETAKKEPVKPVDEEGPKPAPARKTSEPAKPADRQVPTVVPKAATAKQKEAEPAEKRERGSGKLQSGFRR